jgi:hypothetical protein
VKIKRHSLLYPDWKTQVERYLGLRLPYTANDLIWFLYDAGLPPSEAAYEIRRQGIPHEMGTYR